MYNVVKFKHSSKNSSTSVKISVIKEFRNLTGSSLKDAKNAVEGMEISCFMDCDPVKLNKYKFDIQKYGYDVVITIEGNNQEDINESKDTLKMQLIAAVVADDVANVQFLVNQLYGNAWRI